MFSTRYEAWSRYIFTSCFQLVMQPTELFTLNNILSRGFSTDNVKLLFGFFFEPLELSNDSFTPIFFTCLRNVENKTGQLSIAVKRDNKVRLRRII